MFSVSIGVRYQLRSIFFCFWLYSVPIHFRTSQHGFYS